MGCTQSKIENEEAVTRCKDRKQFMKESVSARNAFAAAHSAYAMSLKNTGAALSDYAHGEVIQPPHYSKPYNSIDHTSATSSSASNNIILNSSNVPATSASDSLPPPPPPLPNFSPAPLQRAASMPEFKVKTERTKREETILEDEEKEEEEEVNEGLKRRSGSSKNRSGGGKIGGSGITNSSNMDATTPPPPPEPNQWDYFFSDVEHMPGPTLSEVAEGNQVETIERNVHTTRNEDMAMDKKKAAKVFEEEETNRKGGAVDDVAEENVEEVVMKNVKKGGKQGGVGVMEGRRGGGGGIKALANVNLLHIFIDLDDHFLKASESAHEVSKMLEATRLHYHSNFADNRGDLVFPL